MQVKTKQRVDDFGEVYTGENEIHAILDLTEEFLRIPSSKYLEPAAGRGDFVVAILKRKLGYHKPRSVEEQCNLLLTIMANLYSIEILKDNVEETKNSLRQVVREVSSDLLEAVEAILSANIIHGNTLTNQDLSNGGPICFTEWGVSGVKIWPIRRVAFDGVGKDSYD